MHNISTSTAMMPKLTRRRMSSLICFAGVGLSLTDAYISPPAFRLSRSQRSLGRNLAVHSSVPAGTGMGPSVKIKILKTDAKTSAIPEDLLDLSVEEVKALLVDVLPRMTGTTEECNLVEGYINALEDKYVPVQTLDFLNLAMGGEWQLLFSTNQLGRPSARLRLRELVQRVAPNSLNGKVTNVARWDLAEAGPDSAFDARGTFSVKCSYSINQGARMNIDLDEHVIELAPGSVVPSDVEGLVGMIHGAMPSELFDPNELAMDTTYLDGDLRIVRLTGSRLEGIRNVFIRSGTVEINPTKKDDYDDLGQ